MGFSEAMHYELMIKAAYYYYEKRMTQTSIAELLGISRLTLGKLLKEARDSGVVSISITDPRNIKVLLEYEDALQKKYGLKRAVVANSVSEDGDIAQQIAGAAADYLFCNLRSGYKISISWGKTMQLLIDKLSPNPNVKNLEVMTLMGGAGTTETYIQPELLAGILISKYSGHGYTINAPFFCQSEEVCRSICQEPRVRDVLLRSAEADMTLVGVGEKPSVSPDYWGTQCFDRETLEEIVASDAVGDICGNFFDVDGRPCCPDVSRRVVAVGLDQLRTHKCVVTAAGGEKKYQALRGALAGGYLDVLITDRFTAEALLA